MVNVCSRSILSESDLTIIWQGSRIRHWIVRSSFYSMSRLVCWFLLRKITKHSKLFSLCIFEKARKVFAKFECESCGIADHSLLKVNFNKVALLET